MMGEKSHVTLQQEVCIVCGQTFDTGSILMDTRLRMVKGRPELRETFDHKTVTGYGMCPEHAKLHEDGYVALVGIDEELSVQEANGTFKPEGAHRTGAIAHVRRSVWPHVFDIDAPEGPMVFAEAGTVEALGRMMAEAADQDGEGESEEE